ncbi:MAG: hypothetical protein HYR64_04690 [Fimbriimonas ginsengisoli]|uniref:ARG and Rhodanese-Phosphatase-superfamily-associated domain-containing protein n=1 Tax=Fimbriimonas ginsengisoli TaxID=1005039 RepID=A0A931PTF4_FIMGI|nr:hypothetical protein [Fimbriimonas ginsengisoli]MBI3744670.1 hypothetical protein [Chloroflexota bacterium]
MFKLTPFAAIALCALAGAQAGRSAHPKPQPVAQKLTLGTPVQIGTLAIVPIVSTVPLAREKYRTLAEATKLGLVEIVELPGGQEVNSLEVRNKGDLPLLLFAGELLLGGKQDRIVGKDSIVPAKGRRDVPVFCVEHGRWSGSTNFRGGDTFVPSAVRQAAVQGGRQDQVWDRVAKANADVGVAPSTGTFRATVDSPKVRGAADHLMALVNARFKPTAGTVGVICWMNGRIHSADLFANGGLFSASRAKLFRSYALDVQLLSSPKATPVDARACKAFLAAIVAAKRGAMEGDAFGHGVRLMDKAVAGYESGGAKFRRPFDAGGASAGFAHGTYTPGK